MKGYAKVRRSLFGVARGFAFRACSFNINRPVKLEHTVIYLHLSRRHLHAVTNSLDTMPVSAPARARRSRRLQKR
jgi:hypothetical protein